MIEKHRSDTIEKYYPVKIKIKLLDEFLELLVDRHVTFIQMFLLDLQNHSYLVVDLTFKASNICPNCTS